jgi:phosphoglycolate phosphatase-like HAD superfamily hydrolase
VKDGAIAFDFDGTLIHSGSDKGVHIMYAVYEACAATRFRQFLHPHEPGRDVERLLRGLLQYPGAPRFQQIVALLNSLIHDRPLAVEAPDGLALDPDLSAEYASLRRTCDATYTALNDAAAAKCWKALPAALETLPMLAADFDLYIASGVPQDNLETDLARHGYDRRLFQCVWGTDRQGGGDKAELLGWIRARGYSDVLFVGDANRDLEYARKAGVKFYGYGVPRISCSCPCRSGEAFRIRRNRAAGQKRTKSFSGRGPAGSWMHSFPANHSPRPRAPTWSTRSVPPAGNAARLPVSAKSVRTLRVEPGCVVPTGGDVSEFL